MKNYRLMKEVRVKGEEVTAAAGLIFITDCITFGFIFPSHVEFSVLKSC